MAAAGAYLIAKWAASPVLLVLRRTGWRGTWPRRVDAALNLACLPLTEAADRERRRDVTPALETGDRLPDVQLTLEEGARSVRSFAGHPLLLVLIRGNWCSYSRMHLADLGAAAPQLADLGVQLLVVSSHADPEWWHRHGIGVPMAADPTGALFRVLGVQVDSWLETAWGRVLPHESAFLFDAAGRLVAADVRRVSATRPGQTFLSATEWVRLAKSLD